MIKVMAFPGRYVQGAGALDAAGKFISALGTKALVVWGKTTASLISDRLTASLAESGVAMTGFTFSGECSKNQRDLGIARAQEVGADVIVGAGGGKAIDLAKAIAITVGARMVSLPTIASNDAPTSACTVYYTDEHVIDGYGIWARNPDMVLVDTQVIANAPVDWLVTGMGDALATWFEAEASFKGRRVAFAGGASTMAAMSLARLCYETLISHGIAAKMDVEQHVVTPDLEKVVEANTLLSGLGWESGGLATAHTIGNGITILECTHPYTHGQKVAFGLVTQLCLDGDTDPEERSDVIDFMINVGLPVTFAEIGMEKLTPEELMAAARTLTEPGNFIHNHVFPVTADDLFGAMVKADALGRAHMAALAKA